MNNLAQDVQNVWDALTPEDIEYARTHHNDEYSPFATLHDVCDANELLPIYDGDLDDSHIAYLTQVMNEFNRQFLTKYPK